MNSDALARSTRTDLYLGVVAPVGIRRDSFQASLVRVLKPFGYRVEMIRLSELLQDFPGVKLEEGTEDSRLRTAMDAGTQLRERFGGDVLAMAAVVEAQRLRGADNHQPTAFVFWSLKHPDEVALLRRVYGGGFHAIGLFASDDERIAELKQRPGLDEKLAQAHVDRDREESGRSQGQRTRDTFHRADVFLSWAGKVSDEALQRYIDVLFGSPEVTPTADEHRMFLAYSAALRSGELSRQVGATLVSARGDVVGLGANDVPRRGGGLYWPTADDDRDICRGEDANIVTRRALLESVAKELAQTVPQSDISAIMTALEGSRLKEITEYGRAVHAEMDALLSCARSGHSTRGSTLYVTTYPCHNCARHIIAAGVERVVFVEPYPKSRALDLHHKDIVEVSPGDSSDDRVCFEPYIGVGPRRFFDYFSLNLGDGYELERKDKLGRLVRWDRNSAAPRVQLSKVSLAESEAMVGRNLLAKKGQLS